MVAQHDAGKLLCLCSKNNEADIMAVFDGRPEMVLKPKHIIARRINWRPKSENLKSLADELQLGLDTFIFLDNNPLDCAEVRANCPQVLTLQLPQESEFIPRFLQHIWAFDRRTRTQEDSQRTLFYKQNLERQHYMDQALSLSDFLESLELNIQIVEMLPSHLPRVAQLTQRTNQFNVNKISRTENEIQSLIDREQYRCLTVTVSDRFGEYGLVGLILFKEDKDTIVVDTFLLSCRVLGRGVEHRMLARLGEIAQVTKRHYVDVLYQRRERNQPALDFLNDVGAQFRKVLDEGCLLFRFPADQIVKLTYQSRMVADKNSQFQGVNINPSSAINTDQSAWLKSDLQNRIATSLYDSKEILQIIRTRKRNLPVTGVNFVAPRTPTEKILSEIWCNLLGLEKVGVYDDFFEVGGHSLLATQMLSRIWENFQVEIPVQALFTAGFAIADLAQSIERYQIERADVADILAVLDELKELSDEEAKMLLDG
jgi:FkbH-like protein